MKLQKSHHCFSSYNYDLTGIVYRIYENKVKKGYKFVPLNENGMEQPGELEFPGWEKLKSFAKDNGFIVSVKGVREW